MVSHSTPDWRHDAVCRDVDPNLFFPIQDTPLNHLPSAQERAALTVCATCPVVTQCLSWALDAGEVEWGVLGGLRACEREALHRARHGTEVAA